MEEDINKENSDEYQSEENKQVKKLDKNRIAIWCGIGGGGVFFLLNLVTNGKVPGGFLGGVVSFIIGYGFAWLVFAFIPQKK